MTDVDIPGYLLSLESENEGLRILAHSACARVNPDLLWSDNGSLKL